MSVMPYLNPVIVVADKKSPLVTRYAARKLQECTYFTVNDLLDELSIYDIQSIVDVAGIVCECVVAIGTDPKSAEVSYGEEVIETVKGFICLVCIINQAECLMPETDDEFMESIFRFLGIVLAYASGPSREFEPRLNMSMSMETISGLTIME